MAGPALLVKLWIAKKLAVLLAVRAFGVKRLYRRGLKLAEYAYGTSYGTSRVSGLGSEASTTSRRRLENVMRHTCHAAMITELWVVRRATGFMERAFESAGFSRRGMPGVGIPRPPPTEAMTGGASKAAEPRVDKVVKPLEGVKPKAEGKTKQG